MPYLKQISLENLKIAALYENNNIEIYSMNFLKMHTIITDSISFITLSPNGLLLACATKSCNIIIYDMVTYEKVKTIQVVEHISNLKFTKDNSKLLITSINKIKIYDMENNSIIFCIDFKYYIHEIFLTFNMLIVMSLHEIIFYNINTYEEQYSICENDIIREICFTDKSLCYIIIY